MLFFDLIALTEFNTIFYLGPTTTLFKASLVFAWLQRVNWAIRDF